MGKNIQFRRAMEKAVVAAKEWKKSCLEFTGGKFGAQEEAISFPLFLRDYANENFEEYLVK